MMIPLAAAEKVSTDAVWIGGVAVVLAAVITLVGVYLQTTKTLKSERERLDDQLTAERERLQLQLAHDRATRERAELRAVLDAAATSMDELIYAAIQAMSAAERIPKETEPEKRLEAEGLLGKRLDTLFAHIRRVDGHSSQLGMRLGADNVVRTLYREAREILGSCYNPLIDMKPEDVDSKLFKNAGDKIAKFENQAAGLIRAEVE